MEPEITISERKEIRARMKRFIASGATDSQIQEATGWSQQRITWARRHVIEDETTAIMAATPLTTFAEFKITCENNINQLDQAIEVALSANNPSAVIAAIRAKQDIAESLIKHGQALGLIDRAEAEPTFLMGIGNLRDMKPSEVRALLSQHSGRLNNLMDRLGKSIIDVGSGPALPQ